MAEVLFVKQLLYLGMGVDDLAVTGVHLYSRLVYHIKAGIVGKLEYPHGKRHLEFDCRVDSAHWHIIPLLAVDCLVHKRDKDAVDDKARDVLFAEHRLLAHLFHKLHRHCDHAVVCPATRYDLDKRH